MRIHLSLVSLLCAQWLLLCPTSLVSGDDFSQGVRNAAPKTPEEERKTFVLPKGFQAQLFASEPEINKPLNMAFDSRGRLWITNTLEYPYPVEVGKPGRDSIKVLEDTNSDGRADTITTFADGLNIPMGLYPYKDGVVCFSIPNIWFLRDTDGDGKCDQREILYGPFDHTRDAHGLCNGFTRGYDGWLYACHGFNNQSSVSGWDGNVVTMHSGNTFRFKLDGSRIEHFTQGQVNPFGMSYDGRGNLLTADCHTKPVTLLLQRGYYESFGKPHDGLGFVPPVMEHLHGSTAIGGIAVTHQDSNWPVAFRNNTLGGNVMTSRVNRNSLTYVGSSVEATEVSDFLISGDSWFRPVDLRFDANGALYVADFYNRIIGHYEVPLNHPGRDRDRGRIWKISYSENLAEPSANGDLSKLTPSSLVDGFQSRSHAFRMLAADRLVDEFGELAISVATRGLQHEAPMTRLHCLWVLARLNAATLGQIDAAANDEDTLVRAHAQKVLGVVCSNQEVLQCRKILMRGLADRAPTVRRATATSCLQQLHASLIPALLRCYERSPSNDVHLRHAVKIALKHQLRDDALRTITSDCEPQYIPLVASVCLAIPAEAAADFIVRHFETISQDEQAGVADYIRHAARHASVDAVPDIVRLVRSQHAKDSPTQLELLRTIGDALRRRNLPQPQVVQHWAAELAEQLLAFNHSAAIIPWESLPHPSSSTKTDSTWVWSEKRRPADNEQAIPLWSSFPHGEQRTGIFRSATFQLGDSFEFFIAGHDGFPDQKRQGRNAVQLRDAATHQILKSWGPPRQDHAIKQHWDCKQLAGRDVYVELVDGDSAAAYAWFAVGQFTNHGLNPNGLLADRKAGCELISDFGIEEFHAKLTALLHNANTNIQTQRFIAQTLASLSPSGLRLAVVKSLDLSSLSKELKNQAVQLVADEHLPASAATTYFKSALTSASLQEQQSIAEAMASDRESVATLLSLAKSSHISLRLLRAPSVASKLGAIASADQQRLIKQLTDSIPPEDETIALAIKQRKADFLHTAGSPSGGKAVFGKHCSVCHQVAGVGQQVGPNLDGVGNRGLDRLLEDVLAPNRNVDLAFRASTVVTTDGRAITGLTRERDGAILNMVDMKGQAIRIPIASIEEQSKSLLSPMPANFHEVMDNRRFADLMSYLLSLTE